MSAFAKQPSSAYPAFPLYKAASLDPQMCKQCCFGRGYSTAAPLAPLPEACDACSSSLQPEHRQP
eukprot:4301268-Prymnesium_polylepis.1